MSDSRSRIADDEEQYERYCLHYDVEPEYEPPNFSYRGGGLDCYGNHANIIESCFRSGKSKLEYETTWQQFCEEQDRKKKEIKEKIAAAKAKLTPEEIKLLNIKWAK